MEKTARCLNASRGPHVVLNEPCFGVETEQRADLFPVHGALEHTDPNLRILGPRSVSKSPSSLQASSRESNASRVIGPEGACGMLA